MKKLLLLIIFVPSFIFAQKPDRLDAYIISKNFVSDYVSDVVYKSTEQPNVTITGNGYTVICHFSVDHIVYPYECTMAYIGGSYMRKESWKLLSFYISGKEFYFDKNYKNYIKR